MNSEKKLSLTRLAQGVVLGAVATLIIGFAWGGWYTTSSAETLAKNEARAEVVRVLAPICLSQFDAKPEAVMIKADLGSKSAYQLKSDL
ncbi:MAG TPA: hypothetical protein VD928_00805, partial [Candidatus Paceibacterota bacterium]|nr:hypothetical protein [Candidatus Paceibacterota bacterium]